MLAGNNFEWRRDLGKISKPVDRPEFARLMAQTNEHPLGKFRAIGTVSNMTEFARVFGCSPGAAMLRAPRCQIW